jgi:SET domain-containing protein
MMIVTKAVPFDAAGEQLVGVALHCTLINQSCEPNCVVQRVGDGTMVIKATTDIAANSELSVPAYSLSDSVSSMMREEVRALHTLCACQRCSQEATKQPAKV